MTIRMIRHTRYKLIYLTIILVLNLVILSTRVIRPFGLILYNSPMVNIQVSIFNKTKTSRRITCFMLYRLREAWNSKINMLGWKIMLSLTNLVRTFICWYNTISFCTKKPETIILRKIVDFHNKIVLEPMSKYFLYRTTTFKMMADQINSNRDINLFKSVFKNFASPYVYFKLKLRLNKLYLQIMK